MQQYRSVSIPKALADKLEKCVGHAGWRSLTEIVMYCIRLRQYEFDQLLIEIEEAEALAKEDT